VQKIKALKGSKAVMSDNFEMVLVKIQIKVGKKNKKI